MLIRIDDCIQCLYIYCAMKRLHWPMLESECLVCKFRFNPVLLAFSPLCNILEKKRGTLCCHGNFL